MKHFLLILFLSLPLRAADSTVDELLTGARVALQLNKTNEAYAILNKALEKQPDNAQALFYRGRLFDILGESQKAISDLTRAIENDPKSSQSHQALGELYFKLGRFKDSVSEFEKVLALKPEDKPYHWQQGISLYYAEQFLEGQRQFELHQKVNKNDVENAVWHFLCLARQKGISAARNQILQVGPDMRVPMYEIYRLYQGKGGVDDVLKAAQESTDSKQSLFYAHLYLGLYADISGRKEDAREHFRRATGEFAQPHYMGEVARIHLKSLTK
ncbi:MAG: tetratricopeptide repeat protein [Verrucomicrobiota bacterium]|nr:tetratricopeptide repeat protein [Verrucomicrobiota bacterium]